MSTAIVSAATLSVDVAALSDLQLFSADVDATMDEIWAERETRLRTFRVEENLSQADIAARVGRDQRTIGRWLDRFKIPTKQQQAPKVGRAPTLGATDAEIVDAEVVAEPAPAPASAVEELRRGHRSPEVERRLAEASARRDAEVVWNEVESRKFARVIERVDGLLDALIGLRADESLSRAAVGELLCRHEVELRHASAAIGEVAFSFTR